MPDNYFCFLDKDRPCTESCMSYAGGPVVPKCTLLNAAAVASGLNFLVRTQTKHPVSPPPPEVKL
jgi:hypothetical protein